MFMHVCMSVEFCGGEMGGIRAGEIGRIEFMKYIFFLYFFVFLHMCEYIEIHSTHARSYTYAYFCVQR